MPRTQQWAYPIGFIVSFVFLLFYADRTHFVSIFLPYSLLFVCYVQINKQEIKWQLIIWLALTVRVISFGVLPHFSDDYYRFLWDGMLTVNGVNPYADLPSYIVPKWQNSVAQTWFLKMNSPEYYSVYPPALQWIFALMYYVGGSSELLGVNVFRGVLLLSEIGMVWLITKKNHAQLKKILPWVLLNPLYLVECFGNIHAEGLVVLFVIIAYLFLSAKQTVLSALFASMAVLTKLIPILAIPALFYYVGKKRFVTYMCLLVVLGFIISYPFMQTGWLAHQLSSMMLYFNLFEFNAGLYYLVRWIGFQVVGYNIIQWFGSVSPVVISIIMLFLYIKKSWSKQKILKAMIFSVLVFYAFSSIVHPWYAIYALIPGVLLGYSFSVWWTYFIVLSYVFYQVGDGFWYYLLVAIEYLLLIFVMIYQKRCNTFLNWQVVP